MEILGSQREVGLDLDWLVFSAILSKATFRLGPRLEKCR